MRRSPGVETLVVLLVVTATLVGAVPATADVQTAPSTLETPEGVLGTNQQFDRTEFRIRVFENGSARFTIHYERNLNETEREQFEEYAARFESEETDLYENFRGRANSLVSTGTNATDRDMRATDFQRAAFVRTGFNDVGVVDLSFHWSNFAATQSGTLVVSDVFEGGLYIGPNQALVIETGDGVRFTAIDPNGSLSGNSITDSDSVTWRGEKEFSDERPRLELEPTRAGGAGNGTSDGTGSTTDGSGSGDGNDGTNGGDGTTVAGVNEGESFPMMPLLLVVALVGIAGAVVWWRTREDDGQFPTPDTSDTGDSPEMATGRPEQPMSDVDSSDAGAPDPETTAAAAAGTTAVDESAPPESSSPAISDEELLTDEDRVIRLLEDNGGRMRQSNIVDETDWSKSKVSMLLSEMEDEGDISKLRVGRENIVSLAGHEPDAAGSPFDDDDGF
ncbi:helix-turn-helix transcriptional regulator [Haloarchaeobius sp. DFWS5]|uniref:helix-turn-helix transcriptional regulator n=1 Tax=Haloarchaeobius sp. DFWS5 TaxID=3446114 RepID=UPI003EBCC1D3